MPMLAVPLQRSKTGKQEREEYKEIFIFESDARVCTSSKRVR